MVVVDGYRCEIAWEEIVRFETIILIVILGALELDFWQVSREAFLENPPSRRTLGTLWTFRARTREAQGPPGRPGNLWGMVRRPDLMYVQAEKAQHG